jgi:general stress protein YciG
MSDTNADENAPKKKLRKGFAIMNPEKQKEISRMGGKAAHQKGTGHQFTSEEARIAGRKGGIAAHQKRKDADVRASGNPPLHE